MGVGGFGVTPSRTAIFLTNSLGGRGCWFVMVLLRTIVDIICRKKLYHVDFQGKKRTLLNCWKTVLTH